MKVEIINPRDPCIVIGKIPASCSGERFSREHDAGLHLLRYGMKCLGYPEFEINYEAAGKPTFVKDEGSTVPYFSISHSGGYAVCAISDDEIGCDIEKTRKVPHILDRELEKVCDISFKHLSNEPIPFRTQLWTIYEAIGKHLGIGIPVDRKLIKDNHWKVISWMIMQEYVLTVVQANGDDG